MNESKTCIDAEICTGNPVFCEQCQLMKEGAECAEAVWKEFDRLKAMSVTIATLRTTLSVIAAVTGCADLEEVKQLLRDMQDAKSIIITRTNRAARPIQAALIEKYEQQAKK